MLSARSLPQGRPQHCCCDRWEGRLANVCSLLALTETTEYDMSSRYPCDISGWHSVTARDLCLCCRWTSRLRDDPVDLEGFDMEGSAELSSDVGQ
jgi:hypothetical protein